MSKSLKFILEEEARAKIWVKGPYATPYDDMAQINMDFIQCLVDEIRDEIKKRGEHDTLD